MLTRELGLSEAIKILFPKHPSKWKKWLDALTGEALELEIVANIADLSEIDFESLPEKGITTMLMSGLRKLRKNFPPQTISLPTEVKSSTYNHPSLLWNTAHQPATVSHSNDGKTEMPLLNPMRETGARRSIANFQSEILSFFFYTDLISIILSYVVSIEFNLVREWGKKGRGDGEMYLPYGLSLCGDELFVADSSNHRVQVFHQSNGRFVRSFGKLGYEHGSFMYPFALATRDDKLYVADSKKRDVQEFTLTDFQFLRCLSGRGDSPNISFLPYGLCLVDENTLLVSDSDQHRLLMFNIHDFELKKEMGKEGREPGKLSNPQKICIENDELFVADSGNDRIQVLNLNTGGFVRQYPKTTEAKMQASKSEEKHDLYYPASMVTHGDEVIVADGCNKLVVFDRYKENVRREFFIEGCASAFPGRFVRDLAISNNHLFVCNASKHRVLVFA